MERGPQHAVENLNSRYRLVTVLVQPRLNFQQLLWDLLWNPAEALYEKSNKIRPAAGDFRQTQGQDLALGFGFVGHTPA